MLLLSREDEELQTLAEQIRCHSTDMVPVPDQDATFRLPADYAPATVQKLADFFYDQQRERIYKWAKDKGLRVARKAHLGPQILLLKKGGRLYVKDNRVLFSIVIPKPYGDQMGDEAARVSITSPVASKLLVQSCPDLDIGNVIILEGEERLVLNAGSICLVSALHIASREEGGGWIDDPVNREEGI